MLEIDWVTIIWEIVNFVIISIALYFLVFKPIVKRSAARAIQKARLIDEINRDRELAATNLAEINTRLANLDQEILSITDEAYEQNKVLQAELLDATRDEAQQILQDALLEVRKEQSVDMQKHQNDLVDIILNISSQSLKKVTPKAVHNAMIDELTKRIWDLGRTQMKQVQSIRESLFERQPEAFVTTAFELTPEQELSLVRTFNALADNQVEIDVEINEDLIAGIKVRLGDMIIENSLASQLEQIREEMAESLDLASLEHNG